MNTKLYIIALLVIAACAAAYGKAAQSDRQTQSGQSTGVSPSAATQPAGRGTTAVLVSPDEDYRIGPNDVLDIKVENAPELSGTFRVTASGTFLMPYVGRVTAAKKTTEELAQWIADGLRRDYLKDPKVLVSVKEFNSRSFWILGSVRSPGVFQVEGRPSMLELITLAGGLSEHHGANAYIIRKIKRASDKDLATNVANANGGETAQNTAAEAEPKYEMKSANINALFRGHFDQDVLLESGDMVNIPPTDLFFVAGEVNAPGQFSLKEGTTLRQAISLAQGTTYKAALNRGIVFRENSNGKREELHVDIDAVMKGKKEDLAIMANDIIMVPNSRSKSIGGAVLRAFGLTTITRLP
ncbi:MAG TPA: polysaccharide biosynthesis/export family protein, partial [Blastocatellia bacterium]|nr:polysaccharide biosynthesis/export family protein [Blastocatellia bacterium]